MKTSALLLIAAITQCADAFAPASTSPLSDQASPSMQITKSKRSITTSLNMANDKDLLRWSRSARQAGVDDRVVELKRPLGVVLEEDASGNVYVEAIAPKGNAARTGLVSSYLTPYTS